MLGFEKRWNKAPVLGLFAVVFGGFLAVVAACSTTTESGLIPLTGILIRAETLTAGKGCGSEPSQLYKYVAVVYGYNVDQKDFSVPITSNIFDCYTDGVFIKLPNAPDGNSTFRLEVFAYNHDAYLAGGATLDNARNLATDANARQALRTGAQATPTWTTQCFGTQLTNAEALASCDPLALGLGGLGTALPPTKIALATTTFHLPDGRTATCTNEASDGGLEGGLEGGADSGTEAGVDEAGADAEAGAPDMDAGAADAGDGGATIGFVNVRIRARAGAQILGDTIVACPTIYSLDVPATPTVYDLDVGLLDSANNLVDPAAITACTATTLPGGSSSAVCP